MLIELLYIGLSNLNVQTFADLTLSREKFWSPGSAKYFKMGHPRKSMSTKNVKTDHIRKILMAMEKKNRNLFLTIFLLQNAKNIQLIQFNNFRNFRFYCFPF